MKHELGKKARDKVTGFQGIITARTEHLTGCDRYQVTPPVKADGTKPEEYWFDEAELDIIGDGISPKDVRGKENGGPKDRKLMTKKE
jgi:hypothetical protein